MKTNYEAKFNKNGNIKVGGNIWTFNKLAGSGVLNGCKGTCGKYCTGCYNEKNPKKSSCYVFNSYVHYGWEKSTVMNSHIRNTNIMRSDINKAFKDIRQQLKRAKKKPTAVRIHSSGEIETKEELLKWFDVANENPSIPFYVYTKAYDVLDEVMLLYKIKKLEIPKNFFINISIWHEVGKKCYDTWKSNPQIRAFVYHDGYDYGENLKMDIMCPAYNSKGKMDHRFTCDTCKICYQEKHKVCGCYDH